MVKAVNMLITTLLCITLLVGCDTEQSETYTSNGEEGKVSIVTRTEGDEAEDNFADASTLRISIFEGGSDLTKTYLSDDFGNMYSTILGTRTSGEWKYSLDGGTSSSEYFGFIQDVDGGTIDIVATYPYISNTNLSSVSFSVASQGSTSQLGYMWAKETDIELNSSEITTNLDFQHIMSALNLQMVLLRYAASVTLTSITLTLTDSDNNTKAQIVTAGTIDFTTGEITPTTTNSSQTVTISTNFATMSINGSTKYALYKMIYLPPLEMEESDTLTIDFKIDNVTLPNNIAIKGSQLLNSDNTYGLARGTYYTLDIEIDNYLKFSGDITKSQDWVNIDSTTVTTTNI